MPFQVIGDDVYLDGEKIAEITIHEGTFKDRFKDFLEEEIPETVSMNIQIECPECDHVWDEKFEYNIEGEILV